MEHCLFFCSFYPKVQQLSEKHIWNCLFFLLALLAKQSYAEEMTIVQWRTTGDTSILQILLTRYLIPTQIGGGILSQRFSWGKSYEIWFFVVKEFRQIVNDAYERTLYLHIFKACIRFTLKNSFGELETGCPIFVL